MKFLIFFIKYKYTIIILDGFFYTYDDFSTPGEIVTIEGVGYYPQAGTNFLLGATFKF